jgi:hypothetical protein
MARKLKFLTPVELAAPIESNKNIVTKEYVDNKAINLKFVTTSSTVTEDTCKAINYVEYILEASSATTLRNLDDGMYLLEFIINKDPNIALSLDNISTVIAVHKGTTSSSTMFMLPEFIKTSNNDYTDLLLCTAVYTSGYSENEAELQDDSIKIFGVRVALNRSTFDEDFSETESIRKLITDIKVHRL